MYLTYDMPTKCFNLMYGNRIAINNIYVPDAMNITFGYLYDMEFEKRREEKSTGKPVKEGFKFRGIHIIQGDGEER